MPYLPYGRADRKFEKGNPNPLRSFLWTLEDIGGFDEINICDIHNNKALEGFNLPIKEKTQLSCYNASLPLNFKTDYDIILAPDKGSVDKAATIAEHLEVDVHNCGKERDVSTGQIIKRLEAKGYAGLVVLGIGSYSYQYVTRDTHGSAVKATWVEKGGKGVDVFKDPKTDSKKKSAKGLLRIELEDDTYKLYDQQTWGGQESQGELKEVFRDSKLLKETSLQEIRERVKLSLK